ncbi:MAG: NUDIX domain-containing protein [Lachnospiraceae bacterium]|nr:NUDIX domain-containing protein [Lachnospiraceae bacterium]
MDMKSKLTTLCYLEKDGMYLMMHRVKKEHDINKDKWIGIGGHFEGLESPEECLLRETREETGLLLTSWQFRGIVTFITDMNFVEYMCLYTADAWEGTLSECDEGELEWVRKEDVYGLPIWEGDRIFFRLLEGRREFFSLKLRYEGERLVEAVLDGKNILVEE